ncbi:hypothetical protein ACLOJK_010982 [Asimina triloba]
MEWVRGAMLGRGSFGTVNLATALCRDALRTPAIMAVKSSMASQASSLRHEKEILMKLQDCPRILRCYGDELTTEGGGQLYNIFLEYVPGGTLADRVRSWGGRLPEADARRYARSIVQGLICVHEKGLVHCDVKLQNVLVGSSPNCFDVKIADFGLAKEAGEKIEGGAWLRGTPLYMSPESVARGEYEAPADIWSLGCAVVEMITGKPAWKFTAGAEANAVLFRIGFGDELPEIPKELSEEGRDFLSRCFVRDPKLRWTAEMLLNHPFVAEDVKSGDALPSVSPRSALDFPQWCSFQSSSAESFTISGGEFPQTGRCDFSAMDRIRQLATPKLPDWSEENWVVARQTDSPVFNFGDEDEAEAEEEIQIQIATSSIGPDSHYSLVLEEMMSRDGSRNWNSEQSEAEAESVEGVAASSSDSSVSLPPPTSFLNSTYGSEPDGRNVFQITNSTMEFGVSGREGLDTSSNSKTNIESYFLPDFRDFDCINYCNSIEYKHTIFS